MPAVVVVHENRGLNPYIEDVARRMATAGFLALVPDALTSVGGYPGTDQEGVTLQCGLDRDKWVEDFVAAVWRMQSHAYSTGKVGVVGFCYGAGSRTHWPCGCLRSVPPCRSTVDSPWPPT